MNVKEYLNSIAVTSINLVATSSDKGYFLKDDDDLEIVLSCTVETRKELDKFGPGSEQWIKALQECRVFHFIANTDNTERWMFTTKNGSSSIHYDFL